MSIRIGDASRRRRFAADPAKQRWYAQHRSRRFARRFLGGIIQNPVLDRPSTRLLSKAAP